MDRPNSADDREYQEPAQDRGQYQLYGTDPLTWQAQPPCVIPEWSELPLQGSAFQAGMPHPGFAYYASLWNYPLGPNDTLTANAGQSWYPNPAGATISATPVPGLLDRGAGGTQPDQGMGSLEIEFGGEKFTVKSTAVMSATRVRSVLLDGELYWDTSLEAKRRKTAEKTLPALFVVQSTGVCAFAEPESSTCGSSVCLGERGAGGGIGDFASLCATHMREEGFKKVLPCSSCIMSGQYPWDAPMKASLSAASSATITSAGALCVACRTQAQSRARAK